MAASFHGAPALIHGAPALIHGTPALIHGAPALIHGADGGVQYKNIFVERKIKFTLHKLFCYP
jgi:hypothetical protein